MHAWFYITYIVRNPPPARRIENSTKFSKGDGLDSILIFNSESMRKRDDLFQRFAVVT